jgi:ferritin-like metal-binding protein YciE
VKAKWATLPPDVQRYVLDRESQTHKAITEKGQRASLYDAIEQAIGENKTALVAEYGDIPRAIQMLVNVSTQAGRDPLRFIEWFAGQRGIDLRAHFASQAGQPAAPADPMQNALVSEVTQLKQHIERQQAETLQSTISQFEQAKDANGKPLRPHFADVRLDMGRLIASGAAQGLEDAYAKAVRMNDAVWAKAQAVEEAERAAKAKAEAAAKAAEAKKAASINLRSRGAVSGSPGRPQDIRSSLEATYRKLTG